ncbi:tyrosine-type recombinase/integrase [Pseudomonas japonica]|uniref:tyrosine-type recombinase/integrase n=1 Tax=Pseudomonas japonica TaxID=256466 RepID=UPI003A8994B4
MNNYWMPALALVPFRAITPMMLRKIVADTEWPSQTVKRAAIARLKALCKAAVLDEVIDRSPAASIQLPAKSKKKIEPFSVREAESIVNWMSTTLPPRLQIYTAFYEFAFFTGMRTGEMMGLRWDEIDLEKKTAHVCRIVVDRQLMERTKTKYTRTVMLNTRAVSAIRKAKEIAEHEDRHKRRVSAPSPFVFQPLGGAPHMMAPETPGAHFNAAVKALGLPPRPQYNCRHTYATMCLMSGINPAFIAGQLGHSVQVLLTTYAKWLNSTSDWSEIEKLEVRVIGTKSVQD